MVHPGTLNETASGASLPALTPVGFILDGDDWQPGDIAFIFNGPVGQRYSIADLRVAAAASDLLKVVRAYVRYMDDPDEGSLDIEETLQRDMRAALAKAEAVSS